MRTSMVGRTTASAALALVVLCVAAPRSASAGDAGLAQRLREYETRIAEYEKILERFYRGETVDDAHKRVNAQVGEFNRQIEEKTAQLDAAKKQLDADLAPLNALTERIAVMDTFLKSMADPSTPTAVKQYNAVVEERNKLVAQHNELNRAARVKVEVYNALVERVQAEIELARSRLSVEKAKVGSKIDDYERLIESDTDVAFFTAVNALYAELKGEVRRGGRDRRLGAAVERVRGFRRELGRWAIKRAEGRENGLIIVEAALDGDEPAFFIVDTGAMQTTINREMVDALGLAGSIGDATKLVLAGGEKIQGFKFTFPRISVGGQTERDVSGVVVKPSDVGIDGLLGQSFLKRFIYTIDETRPLKLILKPRPQ